MSVIEQQTGPVQHGRGPRLLVPAVGVRLEPLPVFRRSLAWADAPAAFTDPQNFRENNDKTKTPPAGSCWTIKSGGSAGRVEASHMSNAGREITREEGENAARIYCSQTSSWSRLDWVHCSALWVTERETGHCDWSGICLPQVDFRQVETQHRELLHLLDGPLIKEIAHGWRSTVSNCRKATFTKTLVHTDVDSCTPLKCLAEPSSMW